MDSNEQALKYAREVLEALPSSHPDRPGLLNNLGNHFGDRYRRTGSMIDLEQALKYTQEAIAAAPSENPDRASYLSNLGMYFGCKQSQTDSMDDLRQAITYTQEAIAATPSGHHDRTSMLNNVGVFFRDRYSRTGGTGDLEQAIAYARQTLAAVPSDHFDRAAMLHNLSTCFGDKFGRTGSMNDLEQAITYAQQALVTTPSDHSHRAGCLDNLGIRFRDRHLRTGSMNDLEQAIAYAQKAVSAPVSDHFHRARCLNNLGNCFQNRYRRTGSMDDLEQAITHTQEALTATPSNHPYRANMLNNLSICFGGRYVRTGSMDDLEQAITYAQQALVTTPSDHPDRASILNNLSLRVGHRYSRTSSTEDLERAITYAQQALVTTPSDHPDRASILNSLSIRYGDRYTRAGSMDDIKRAITYAQQALLASPTNHLARAWYLNNLSILLRHTHSHTGSMKDLEQAITYAQQAVAAIPSGHPDEASRLNNLGNCFRTRYDRTDSIEDLEQAIAYAKEAVALIPSDHPERAGCLSNLGICFQNRYSRTRDEKDGERSVQLFKAGIDCVASLPLSRIVNGRLAMLSFCRRGIWTEAALIAETLVSLLPHLCSRYLNRDDQLHALKHVSGFAADTCSLSLKINDPRQALQRIEFGRTLILGYLIDGRSDSSELALEYPDLAKEYDLLRYQTFGPLDGPQDPRIRDRLLQERRNASLLLEDCEHRIRSHSEFKQFLQPASVHELMCSAVEGPIVIVNSTNISSDAIIVSESVVEVVPLASMSLQPPKSFRNALGRHRASRERDYQRDIESDLLHQHDASFLSWLWLTCVKPVLQKVTENKVEGTVSETPRIWWIGTGAANSLPFHAAGIYGHGAQKSTENCLSQCISSYTPSIKSLEHARKIASTASTLFSKNQSLLVVTMPTTPDHAPLLGARMEAEAIQSVAGQTWTVRSLAYPTASHVLEAIKDVNIAHFACHGSSDPTDPMTSHLLLQKEDGCNKSVDRLTVSALLDANTQKHSWIAYLSACSTAEVKMRTLADEALHLTSAFQMAGFAHVIGSLQPADDEICVQVAKFFYSFLADAKDSMRQNRSVPEALNYAVRQVAQQHPDRPDLWAPFIHLGA